MFEAASATEEYHSNIVNLIVNIPIVCYTELVPSGDMHCIDIFLRFLNLKLNKIFGPAASKDYEQLPPILTCLIKCVRCNSAIRHYVRSQVLPPLGDGDVKTRPEEGTTTRNHLCKLLTYPSTQISDLVAELLFVLCKENVGRMIKYTGYGNAAGLFAKRGLLGGRISENQAQYSSDSEDSDTDEYKQLEHGINPVTGCFEPPHEDPLAGMSEEQVRRCSGQSRDQMTISLQKEYEAEQLANLIDRLHRQGIVMPCKIGEDGTPVPVDHIVELQKEIPEQQRDHKRKT
jgi:hypothetical protein